MGKIKFEIEFTNLNRSVKARKKTKAVAIQQERGFIEAFNALPDELRDDKFLSAYIKTRALARTTRGLLKQERDQAQATLDRIKKIEKKTKHEGELVYAIRNKDFQYNYWELPSGKIFKEVIARPGLTLNK